MALGKKDSKFSRNGKSSVLGRKRRSSQLAPSQPPRQTGVAFGYGRGSTVGQEISNEPQKTQVEAYFNYRLLPQGLTWGGWYCDTAASGKATFRQRQAGGVLCQRLQRGDHVVISRFDLAFRSAVDALLMLELWENQGVTIHFMDLNVDGSTEVGKKFIRDYAFFAKIERQRIRERVKQGLATIRAAGHSLAGYVPRACTKTPIGMKLVKARKRSDWRFEWQEPAIRSMKDMYDLRQRTGWTLRQISDRLREQNSPTVSGRKRWTFQTVCKLLQRYEKYLASGDLPEYALPEKSISPTTPPPGDASAQPVPESASADRCREDESSTEQ